MLEEAPTTLTHSSKVLYTDTLTELKDKKKKTGYTTQFTVLPFRWT